MSEKNSKIIKQKKPKKRRKAAPFGLWNMLKLALLLAILGFGLFVFSGKTFQAPKWVQQRIEAELNAVLVKGDVTLDTIDIHFEKGIKPIVTLHDISLQNARGKTVAQVSNLSATLSPMALLDGQIHANRVQLNTASIHLQRAENGEFDLGFGLAASDIETPTATLAEMLDSIDKAFEAPVLAAIETVDLNDLTLNFLDSRARRGWLLHQGNLRLVQDAENISVSLGFDLSSGSDQSIVAELSFESQKGSAGAVFGAKIKQVAARDLASQIPALAWLGALEAPISGAVRAEINPDGQLGDMDGTLEIGSGFLRPTEDVKAIAFNSGRAYFGYDPKQQKVRFDELSVQTSAGKLVAEGHAYLREMVDGIPAVMLGQFRILEGLLDPKDIFEAPVVISGGAADLRLRLDPFQLSIGQAVIVDGEHSYRFKGEVSADNKGWHVAMDANADTIDPARMLALWPVGQVANTRNWIKKFLVSANLFNVNASLRIENDQKPVTALGFEFTDTNLIFIKNMPPVTGGAGHGAISRDVFTVVVDKGIVTPPVGGVLDAAGTVFQVPDIKPKIPEAVVSLKIKGPIQAALSLLDQPPLSVATKAGIKVDLAEGQAQITGSARFLLKKKLLIDDVDYDVTARLLNVSTDKLIEGRTIRAKELELRATSDDLVISGAAFLGKVPVRGSWYQKMGKQNVGISKLEGTVELSQRFVDEFSIGLPKGSVSGAGVGQIEIDLHKGRAPKFRLVSDLNRLGLRLPDLGWALSKSAKGQLKVSGILGSLPRVDSLILRGAGLKAAGKVSLNANGDLKSARFSRVQLGGWLDAPIELIGRGKGATPSIRVLGGVIDTRKTSFGKGGGGASGQSGGDISVSLDRLIVSDGITLTSFKGKFRRQKGFNGTFTARVNGKAPIAGSVVPTKGGSAYRIKSNNAGAVFLAAGVMDKVRQGSLDLTLVPIKGATGQYNGRLTGQKIRVHDAPAMAGLLGAISGVGLLQQLNGNGIMFAEYQVNFRLTPHQVVITSGSAVGASMGVSMNGVYNLAAGTLDVRGVLSPIYFLNGIGQIFSRKREGLFGFNYRMTGPADDPKVRVNPLSIFTPGMFREIFKRPPPKVIE